MTDLTLYAVAGASATVLALALRALMRGSPSPQATAAPAAPSEPSKKPSSPKPLVVPLDGASDGESDDPEVTIVRLQMEPSDFPDLFDEEDDAPAPVAKTIPLVADEGADEDEPTRTSAVILVSAAGQTDVGQRRKRNEDSYLQMDAHGVYVVADGMGGYAGGDIASQTAVSTIERAFKTKTFDGKIRGELPRRAEETLTLKAVRNIGPHRLGLSVLASGDRSDVGNQHMAGYVVANVTGQLALGQHWRLRARIENLLDAQYETVAGFRMQERSAFVDLAYQWQ